MKNYILIISILTTVVIFLVVYFGDYIERFENAASSVSTAARTAANSDVKTTYERLVEARKTDFYEKKNPLTITKQEESMNLQMENYNNGVYDRYSSITDPVGDEFLPYTIKNYKDDPAAISKNNMNQYTIINVYKNTLDRQPTDKELNKNLQDFYENDIDEELLKLRIYNSTEYKIITNMQSNDIKPELITNISKGQLKEKLLKYYKDQHNTVLTNTRLIDILIKCYIHLQFNDYLFKAMLMHDKYLAFENRLRNEYMISDTKLLEVFNQTFLLSELRLIANELKRQDILKRKALQIPVALYNNNQSELNTSNVMMGAGKHISDIVRNSDNVFNINIMVNDKKDEKTSMPFSRQKPRPPQRPPQSQQMQRPPQRPQQSQQMQQSQQQSNQISPNSHYTANNQNIHNILNSINNKNSEAVSLITNNAATIGNVGNIATLGTGISAVSSGADIRKTNIVSDISNIVSATSGTSGTASATSGTASATSGTAGATSGTASATSGTAGATSGTAGATSGTAGATSGTAGATSGTASATSDTSAYDQLYKDSQYEDEADGTDTGYYEDGADGADGADEQEISTRIYDPIDYKYHYRGEQGLPRPNVCSYGTKQIVQPVFLSSSGTDLKEAEENTQVGSIMPKFEYYEYEDTV